MILHADQVYTLQTTGIVINQMSAQTKALTDRKTGGKMNWKVSLTKGLKDEQSDSQQTDRWRKRPSEVIWLLKSKERSEGYLQSRMRMQSRMATSAPVLSPVELLRASALHISMLPSLSHVQTRIVSVPVLLCMGMCPSEITTATRWVLLCIWPNPVRRVKIPAVLSVKSWVLSLLRNERSGLSADCSGPRLT